jgi:methyl-accepting chemotaxis protein
MIFLLNPAIRLIGSIDFRRKLLALGVLVMIPVLILGFLVWDRAQQQISRVDMAKRSLPTQMALLNLNLALQAHAVDALRLADKDGKENPQRKLAATAMDNAAQALQEAIKDEKVAASIKALRAEWDALASAAGGSRKDIVKSHSSISENVVALTELIVDTSELRLLGERDSQQLVEVVTVRLPVLTTSLALARNTGYAAILDQRLPPAMRQPLAVARGRIDGSVDWLVDDAQKIAGRQPATGKELESAVGELSNAVLGLQEFLVTKVLDTSDYDVAPQDYLARGDKAMSAIQLVGGTAIAALDRVLASRLGELKKRQTLVTTLICGVLLALAYTLCAAYMAITRPLRRLTEASSTMARGDLRVRIDVNSKDELAELAASFNHMAESFSRVITGVNQSVSGVLDASTQLGKKGEAIRLASERQQDASERTASEVQDLTTSIAEIASNAGDTSIVALAARKHTDIGREHAKLAVRRMDDTSASVRAASEVVQALYRRSESINAMLLTIKDIAAQTNLLALNAAIEAARAGDAGRGFAVVADEVRKLADLSNKAAQEIGGIVRHIQNDTQQTSEMMKANERSAVLSTEALDGLAEALGTITSEVDRASVHVQTIADGTEVQRESSTRIAQNMQEVTVMAEENRAHAHDTATAIEGLRELAGRLRSVVAGLKTA